MKVCAWCGDEIHEENGSIESREFFRYGKLCLYFCDGKCENYYKQNPLYAVVERGNA
jgi:ribosomal protein L24E